MIAFKSKTSGRYGCLKKGLLFISILLYLFTLLGSHVTFIFATWNALLLPNLMFERFPPNFWLLVSLLSHYYVLFRLKSIFRLVRDLRDLVNSCTSPFKSKIIRISTIITVFSFSLFILSFVQDALLYRALENTPTNKTQLSVQLFVKYLRLESTAKNIVGQVFVLMISTSFFGMVIIIVWFLGLFCYVIKLLLRESNHELSQFHGRNVEARDLMMIQKRYTTMLSLLSRLNSLFSSLLLCYFGVWLVEMCNGIPRMIFYATTSGRNAQLAHTTTTVIRISAATISLAWLSSGVKSETYKAFLLARNLPFQCCSLTKDAFCLLPYLLSQLSEPRSELILGGLISVDQRLIISLLGAIITYTVLVIQMNPQISHHVQILFL